MIPVIRAAPLSFSKRRDVLMTTGSRNSRVLNQIIIRGFEELHSIHGFPSSQSGVAEDAVDARGAEGDDVGIEHPESEAPVALRGMTGVEFEEGRLLPRFVPPVAGDQGVVLVGQATARPPIVELAGGDLESAEEASHGDLGAIGPVVDEVDEGVAGIVGNPDFVQNSPSSFFSSRCSFINSATTSFLRWSLSRSAAMVRWSWSSGAAFSRSKAAGPFSKNCFCQM